MPRSHHGAVLSFLLALAAGSPAPARAQMAAADTTHRGLPLTPARWARFTTSQGTWISLDVSPDGRTIAFDLLGDLYTIPIAGGHATRLTNGLAYDMQPRYSPDGKQIVFVSDQSGDDNLHLIGADGQGSRQLTYDIGGSYISPDWSPDGEYIVTSKGAPDANALFPVEQLWMVNVHGGIGLPVTTDVPPGLRMLGPSMTPDGRYIWYAQRAGQWQYNAIFPQYELAVYDREGGTRTTMTSRYGSAMRPAISPDGKWLAYGSRQDASTGLRLRELATGEEKWIAYPIQRDDQESRAMMDALPGYSWMPDSKSIVISYGGKIWRVPTDGTEPAEIPFTVDAEVAVGPEVKFSYPIPDSATFTVRQIRDGVPSPDGRKLVFTSLDRLYVMDLPAGTPRRLTTAETGEYYPTWSPDGLAIAYTTWDDHEGTISKVKVTGGAVTKLTNMSAFYQHPAWSPDGRKIVAMRAAARDLEESVDPFIGDGLGTEFIWIPAEGGAATVVGPTNGRSVPTFGRESDRFYSYGPVSSERSNSGAPLPNGFMLVSTRLDGTDLREVLRVNYRVRNGPIGVDLDRTADLMPVDYSREAVPTAPADLILMSPQGDRALAQVGNDFYVVTVPRLGPSAPVVMISKPDSAQVPVRKLTDIGGEFPAWSHDGKTVHWSIGNAFVSYHLDRAAAVDDSLAMAHADSAARSHAAYRPDEQRILMTAQRDIPQGTVVLRGARVVTMRDREVIENADVVVTNNRLVRVGPRGDVPAGATVIDVTGKTIIPGMVDTHTHMWPLWGMHWTRPWMYEALLAYGVTTTRDPQTSTTDVLTYSDRVTAGQIQGPRVYSTGPGVFWSEGIRSLDHARDVLRRYSDYYDTKTFKMYMSGDRRQREWLIMAARELHLMPTTEGGLDYRLNLTHAMDGYPGVEHTMPITPAFGDVVHLFATSGTTNTPTFIVSYGGPWAENFFYTNENTVGDAKLHHFTPSAELDPKIRRRNPGPGPGGWFMRDEYAFPHNAEFTKMLVEGGGHAAVGSHGQLQGLGYHWEMWAMSMGGMDPWEVLRSATLYGAQAIGLGNDVGSLEAGKLADLVVLDANPLENIRNTNTVHFVMMNGRMYTGDNLDEVWPRQRPAPDEPWRHTAPSVSAGIR